MGYVLLAILLVFFTFHFMTFSYPNLDNVPQLFSILVTYVLFLLLFWVERKSQNTPSDKVDKRNRLEVAAWVVGSTLFFLQLYQLAVVLPPTSQVVVCVFASTFYFVIFLLYFVSHGDTPTATGAVQSMAPLPPAAEV